MDFNQLTFWFQGLSQTQQILVSIVTFLTAYLVYQKLSGRGSGLSLFGQSINYATRWSNRGLPGYGDMNPADRLPELIDQFGSPSVFDGSAGGLAVWDVQDLKGTPFTRMEIRDEQIPHASPKPHTDFLYTWYKVQIPTHKVKGLYSISQSIAYDPLKGEMRARCHDLRPNVVTHWIVKKYAEDQINLDEAAGMYGPMIMELFEDDPNGIKYSQLYSEL